MSFEAVLNCLGTRPKSLRSRRAALRLRVRCGTLRSITGAMLAIAVILPASNVAAESDWIGGTSSWNVPANWHNGVVPEADIQAVISNGGTAQVLGIVAAAFDLSLGRQPGESGTLQVGAGSLGVTAGTIVGDFGTGTLVIADGGGVYLNQDLCCPQDSIVGNNAASNGSVTVTGPGSYLDVNGSLSVGKFGTGTLTISNGGAVSLGAEFLVNRNSIIGELAASNGNVTVTGPGSTWYIKGTLSVGKLGKGELTISNGGTVTLDGGNSVSINALSTLNIGAGGTVGSLQGAVAVVNNGVLNFNHTNAVTFSTPISGNGRITKVGGTGNATLVNVAGFTGSFSAQGGRVILPGNLNGSDYAASNGGTLRFAGSTLNLGLTGIQAGVGGAVEYDSATVRSGFLRGPGAHTIIPGANPTSFNGVTAFNSTNIIQNGTASLVNFTNGGSLTNNATLTFNGGVNATTGVINVNNTINTLDVGNSGVVTVNSGGAINNSLGKLVNGGGSRTTINPGGAINLLNATTLELNGALLVNNGVITGTTNVNYGSLAKGTGSYGVVNVNEGGVYSPGNSPGISTAAAVVFESGSFTTGAPRLVMELGGTIPGTQYDQLHVTGVLTLNGTLEVRLVDLGAGVFSPTSGQSFDILDWGSLAGTFSAVQLPTLAGGLAWNTSQLYTAGVLSVASIDLPGDFNLNGVVDAADYVVWRKGLGTTYTQNDYNVWRTHFGQIASSGSGTVANAAVPEPSTLVMLVLAAAGVCSRRCRAA